jgi:hypothetical protein
MFTPMTAALRFLVFGIFALRLPAQIPPGDWAAMLSLEGAWMAEGQGQPGAGTGTLSFKSDLGGKTLIRRNRSEVPASAGRPAFVHEDLTIIYPDSRSGRIRGDYFDSEGHVIHYAAMVEQGGRRIVFASEPDPASPAYRFTYEKLGADRMGMKFEIAAPGKPFQTYLEGTARRQPR